MYKLVDRKKVGSEEGTLRWKYRGIYLDGVSSDWVEDTDVLGSFTPLQLQ